MFKIKNILCFLFFLSLFNASKAISTYEHTNVTNEIQNKNEEICNLGNSNCYIYCLKGIIGNIWKDFPYNARCYVYKLYIMDYVDKGNEIISKEWFSKINQSTFIQVLHIGRSSFEIIEDEAFNSAHFNNTSQLVLDGLKLQHLTKNSFIGLSALQYLKISDIPLKVIDSNVLYAMRYTLEQVIVRGIKEPFSLKNLTGSVALLNLKILHLWYNCFGNLIDENSFTGVKNLSLISIFNCGVTSLHEHTFVHLGSNLESMYFQDNNLTTISAHTFQFLLKVGLKIRLEGNPWICDCNLLDLKYLLKTYPKSFADVPKCASPAEFKNQAIVDSNFCTTNLSINRQSLNDFFLFIKAFVVSILLKMKLFI